MELQQKVADTNFTADYGEGELGAQINSETEFQELSNSKKNVFAETDNNPRIVIQKEKLYVIIKGNYYDSSGTNRDGDLKIYHSDKGKSKNMSSTDGSDITSLPKVFSQYDNNIVFAVGGIKRDKKTLFHAYALILDVRSFLAKRKDSVKIANNQTGRKGSDIISDVISYLDVMMHELNKIYKNEFSTDDASDGGDSTSSTSTSSTSSSNNIEIKTDRHNPIYKATKKRDEINVQKDFYYLKYYENGVLKRIELGKEWSDISRALFRSQDGFSDVLKKAVEDKKTELNAAINDLKEGG